MALSTSGLIFTDDDFIVNGGSLTVSNDGCYAQMNFIINDGEIHIDGTPGQGGGVPGSAPTMNGNGIWVDEGDFTVHGGQVEIQGHYGILTKNGDAIFDGGKVDIITNQYGGIATSSMTISGGELTITVPEDAFAFTRFDTLIEILPKNGKEIVVEKGTSASDAVAMDGSPFVEYASFTPASSTNLRYFHSKEKDAPVLYLGGVGFYSGDAEYAITNSNGTVTTEGASFDNYTIWWGGTNKLQFLDATIAGSHTYRSSEAALYTELQSLEIALQGTNTIISPDTTDRESYGIYSKGECAITGDGSLAITGGEISEADPSSSVMSTGIFLESSLFITDATVNVSGGDVEGSRGMSNGILSMGTVTITNSTVTAVGGKADQSMGIGAMEGLTVNDGTVLTATGGEGYWSSGIMSRDNVVIHGGSTTAACEGNGFGVDAEDLQIYGGEVTAISNNGEATRSDVHLFPDTDAAILAEVGENKDSASQVEGSPFSASQSMPQGGYQVAVSAPYFHSETCKATVITRQPKDISTVVGDGAVFT